MLALAYQVGAYKGKKAVRAIRTRGGTHNVLLQGQAAQRPR